MSRQSEELHKWMDKNGIKNADMQELLGLTSGAVSSLINGRYGISKTSARKLSEAYGMDIYFLMTGEGELFPPQTATGNTAPVIQQQGRNLHGTIMGDIAKDRIIAQLTASNEKMADTISRLSQTVESLTAKL